jgi:hypothetical protein
MLSRLLVRWPLVILAVTLLVVFHRLLMGEVLFWGLPSLQFYPWRQFAFETLRSGQLPLWNPYNGAGAPLIANYQSQFFYPFSWLGLVLPLGFAISVTAVLHLFIAAAGMWVFTGRLGLLTLGRGVSALAFGMCSYLVARLGTYPMVAAAAWLPWLLWAVAGVIWYGRPRDVAWLGLFGALLLLAGHAQTAWYSLLLAGLCALYWTAQQWSPHWWKRLGAVGAGILLGVGVAAIQLLPTLELLRTSQRSNGVNFDFAMNFSYGPVRAMNLLSPNVFGNPGNGSYITEGAFFEDAVYVGLLPLVAALAAIIAWATRRFRRNSDAPPYFSVVPFWCAILIVGFVFALGQYTPVFPLLFDHVPTFSLFQAPVRWHLWTVTALSVLAGVGVSAAWGRGYWLFFGTRLAIVGCIGAALLALFVLPAVIPVEALENEGVQVLISAVVYTGLLGAAAGALTLLQPDQDTGRYSLWSVAVIVFVALDLGWAAQGLNPTVNGRFYERIGGNSAGDVRGYWPEGRAQAEEVVKFGVFLRFSDYRVAVENWEDYRVTNLANMNMLDERYLLNNFDPLRVGHFNAYIDLVERNNGAPRDRLLQAAYVSEIYNADGDAMPLAHDTARAWFAKQVCWHEDAAGLQAALLDAGWSPLDTVHLSGDGGCTEASMDAASVGEVLAVVDERGTVTVTVETENPGWLVLADTDYPGWTATIDGEPGEIQRANLTFRAVEVPAGAREVRFEYRPGWLLPGIVISLISLVLMMLLFRLKMTD